MKERQHPSDALIGCSECRDDLALVAFLSIYPQQNATAYRSQKVIAWSILHDWFRRICKNDQKKMLDNIINGTFIWSDY